MKLNFTSLVEEAYEKLNMVKIINRDQHEYCVAVLTTLAEEASQNGLKPLPEKMPALVHDLIVDLIHNRIQPSKFYESFVKTYGTQPREWWTGLEKGDKFKCEDGLKTYNGKYSHIDGYYFLYTIEEGEIGLDVDYCSPYTEPTKSFRDKLSPELQQEFDKEIVPLIQTK